MIQDCKTQHSFPREDGLVEGTGARITGPDSGIVSRPWARVLNFTSQASHVCGLWHTKDHSNISHHQRLCSFTQQSNHYKPGLC